MLLPLQGESPPNQSTQGVALGWWVIGPTDLFLPQKFTGHQYNKIKSGVNKC